MRTTKKGKTSNIENKTKLDVDFIKIPKDFKSLHELKELVQNYDLVTKLSEALNGYQIMYLESYLMSLEEVLKFIPPSQYDLYSIEHRDNENVFMYFYKYDKDGKRVTKKRTLSESLSLIEIDKNEKVFLVNAEDKKIDICTWSNFVFKKEKIEYKKLYTKVNYIGKIDFTLDPETRVLLVKVHYDFITSQAVGGVWINGRARGYLTCHTYNDYTINGYDIYQFCTKTNKYIGYKGFHQDPHRDWMEIKSRY